jgi:xanthine dehydrogenase YagS FAD-binding subunit
LIGAPTSEQTFAAAASDVLDGARGYGGNDFKIPLTRRTLRAVLAEATLT